MKKTFMKRKSFNFLRNTFLIIQLVLLPGLIIQAVAVAPDTAQQRKKITGTITEENGKPLPGATIMIEGTTVGTISDANGNFLIETTSENQILIFSFMGYKSQTVPIKDQAVVDIIMIPDFQAIDEVVVIGYGTQKKVMRCRHCRVWPQT
jgi:hypothetical protein